MDRVKVIEEYGDLVARALKIVDGAPYWKYIPNPEFARVTISGAEVMLWWTETRSDYDSYVVDTESVVFPEALLDMDKPALTVWKAEQRAAYDRVQAIRARNDRIKKEEAERSLFENLKKKYGA